MVNTRNYKAFISAVEAGEYRNNSSILASIFFCAICLIGACALDINIVSVVGSGIVAALLVVYIILLIKKDPKKILLFECLQTVQTLLSICIILTCAQSKTGIFEIAIILVLVSIITSSVISGLLVRVRLKMNYYEKSRSDSSDIIMPAGLAILTGTIGYFAGKQLTYTPVEFQYLALLFMAIIIATILGFKCTELLLRHIVVCKHNLYDYIRIRSVTEQHL